MKVLQSILPYQNLFLMHFICWKKVLKFRFELALYHHECKLIVWWKWIFEHQSAWRTWKKIKIKEKKNCLQVQDLNTYLVQARPASWFWTAFRSRSTGSMPDGMNTLCQLGGPGSDPLFVSGSLVGSDLWSKYEYWHGSCIPVIQTWVGSLLGA